MATPLSTSDLLESELTAAAMARGLVGRTDSWERLLAIAQTVLGLHQDPIPEDKVHAATDFEASLDLVVAARLLSNVARHVTPEDSENSALIHLLSAAAYALHGNTPSARVECDAFRQLSPNPTPLQAAVLGILAPALCGWAINHVEHGSCHERAVVFLQSMLASGDPDDRVDLMRALDSCAAEVDDPFDMVLVDLAANVASVLEKLAVTVVLREFADRFPANYIDSLVTNGIAAFLPPQRRAILEDGLFQPRNALITLPTSTGKTLLGELALLEALGHDPGTAVFVAPYVAIGNQVVSSLRARDLGDVDIIPLFGSSGTTPSIDGMFRQSIVVATPERFDLLLRNSPEITESLRAVVFDEAHIIQSSGRGARLEGIIARLRLLQRRGLEAKLILLSAVLGDATHVVNWLGGEGNITIVNDKWRSTARRLAIWHQGGRIAWSRAGEQLAPGPQDLTSKLGELPLPWPMAGLFPTNDRRILNNLQQRLDSNVAYLAEFLRDKFQGPVLCVCADRPHTRALARAIASRYDETPTPPARLLALIAKLDSEFQHLHALRRCVLRGVAYHNAGLPHPIRKLIEDCVKEGSIHTVVSTTTLAEGVDLPFRTTIIADWLHWRNREQVPMEPFSLRNIAGRCGRAGSYVEGDTVIIENLLGDLRYTGELNRSSAMSRLLLPPTPLVSAVESSSEEDDEVKAMVESQVLAAIQENDDTLDLAGRITPALLASHSAGGAARSRSLVASAIESITNEDLGALARAASPLTLTPLGKACNATALCPGSVRTLLEKLNELNEPDTDAGLCASLMRECAGFPEQPQGLLDRAVFGKGRKVVKPDDFQFLVQSWLDGDELIEIFQSMPYVQKSKKKVHVSDWLGSV